MQNEHGYKTAISDFFVFGKYDPQKLKNQNFDLKPSKSKIFKYFQKTGIYVIKLIIYYWHAKF